MSEIRPLRSLLFVPGHMERWIGAAAGRGCDGVIYDLVDSVPASETAQARSVVARDLTTPRAPGLTKLVRVGPNGSERLAADLDAVICPGVDGVVLPHVRGPEDVRAVASELNSLEERRGLPIGSTIVLPLIETAEAFRFCYEIATASERVAYMGGATAREGDIARSIGFRWTPAGDETLFLRSWVLMNVRAAGVPYPVTGLWSAIEDLQGLATFAGRSRDLGYVGMMVIHPSHIPIVNEAFSPSSEEIGHWVRLVAAMKAAWSTGRGAIELDGEMIDAAHLKTAQSGLESARQWGLWNPPDES